MHCRVKKKVEEYEYDESMEQAFRKSLFKTFNKTLEEGFFPMVIVDAVNHKVWLFGFFPYDVIPYTWWICIVDVPL